MTVEADDGSNLSDVHFSLKMASFGRMVVDKVVGLLLYSRKQAELN